MKVFLSWSGDLSHRLACCFRDWLPLVIQAVKPYVSSEDIDKGARWATDIADKLEESEYGILFVTKENIEAPWLNFEAGALSKTIDKSRVAPFLFNIKRSEIKGPLLQFQSTVFDKADVEKLLLSVNNCVDTAERLTEDRLKKCVEVWWPQLEMQLGEISKGITPVSPTQQDQQASNTLAILEEILDLTRNEQRLLRSPAMLLPANYLETVLKAALSPSESDRALLTSAFNELSAIYVLLNQLPLNYTNFPEQAREQISNCVLHILVCIEHLAIVLGVKVPRKNPPAKALTEDDLVAAEEAFLRSLENQQIHNLKDKPSTSTDKS